jgi:hypothetical protein
MAQLPNDAERVLIMIREWNWQIHDVAAIRPGLTHDRALNRSTFHIVRGGPSWFFCSGRFNVTVAEMHATLEPFFLARGIALSEVELERKSAMESSLSLTLHCPTRAPDDWKGEPIDRACLSARLRARCGPAEARCLLRLLATAFPEHADREVWQAALTAPTTEPMFEAIGRSFTDHGVACQVRHYIRDDK